MIKAGEYVRTKDKILKVDSFEKDNRNIKCVCFTTGEIYTLELLDEITVKHSKNIIDLIEVGDIVNGKEVYIQDGKLAVELAEHIPPYKLLENIEIETILTKEQYQANCYTVERKE